MHVDLVKVCLAWLASPHNPLLASLSFKHHLLMLLLKLAELSFLEFLENKGMHFENTKRSHLKNEP